MLICFEVPSVNLSSVDREFTFPLSESLHLNTYFSNLTGKFNLSISFLSYRVGFCLYQGNDDAECKDDIYSDTER